MRDWLVRLLGGYTSKDCTKIVNHFLEKQRAVLMPAFAEKVQEVKKSWN